MKALISGAAGFIGSHLTEACLERGWDVVAIDALTTYYSPTLKVQNAAHFREHPRCTFLEADLLEVDLGELMADADVVFHLAAQAGVRASWGLSFDVYTKLNVTLLQRLLEAARHAPLRRFVFASSSSVYGDAETLPTSENQVLRPLSPYGATKALGEHLPHLSFRNYGSPPSPCATSASTARASAPTWRFTASSSRRLRASRSSSTATAARRASSPTSPTSSTRPSPPPSAARPGGYNIGGGARISMREVLDILR